MRLVMALSCLPPHPLFVPCPAPRGQPWDPVPAAVPIPQDARPHLLLVSSSPSSSLAGRGAALIPGGGSLEDFGCGVRGSPASPAHWGAATGVTRYEMTGTGTNQLSGFPELAVGTWLCGGSGAAKALRKKPKPSGGAELTLGSSTHWDTTPAPPVLPGEPGPTVPGPP